MHCRSSADLVRLLATPQLAQQRAETDRRRSRWFSWPESLQRTGRGIKLQNAGGCQRQPFGFDESGAVVQFGGDFFQRPQQRVVAVDDRVLVVVPAVDDLAIDVRRMHGRADGEVVRQQRRAAAAFEQQQSPFAAGEAERLHPEAGEVLHMPGIGDEAPLDAFRERVPQAATAGQTAFLSQHRILIASSRSGLILSAMRIAESGQRSKNVG